MKFWTGAGRLAATLLLALVLASCDHADLPTELTAPQEQVGEPQELLGLGGLLGGLTGTETKVRAIDENGRIRTYTLLREPLLPSLLGTVDQLLTSVTRLLGLDGGTLTVLEHRLVVPRGAVDRPTMFNMTALLTGYIHVDLTAVAPGNSGLFNVGEDGFNRPVLLNLTYERANVDRRDEDDVVILRLNPRGLGYLHQVMPTTVDESRDRATTWLDHFSGYSMAM